MASQTSLRFPTLNLWVMMSLLLNLMKQYQLCCTLFPKISTASIAPRLVRLATGGARRDISTHIMKGFFRPNSGAGEIPQSVEYYTNLNTLRPRRGVLVSPTFRFGLEGCAGLCVVFWQETKTQKSPPKVKTINDMVATRRNKKQGNYQKGDKVEVSVSYW